MSKEPPVRYYSSFSDDFSQTACQDYVLPEQYRWVRSDWRSRLRSGIIYAAALAFSSVYCRLFLHVRIRGSRLLRQDKNSGIFLYGNHTQPIGDVFDPALACFPRRIYTLASPANLGIPVLGRLLPYLGALPIPGSIAGMKELSQALALRLEQKACIVVYPEAHVWEYCTQIRPFSDTSFKYPVKYGVPAYCMTAVYRKRLLGRRPSCTLYIDGPFLPDASLPPRRQASELHRQIYACMVARSRQSNCSYIRYAPAAEAPVPSPDSSK